MTNIKRSLKSVEDMQNAYKDIFDPMFEAMLKGEMDNRKRQTWTWYFF